MSQQPDTGETVASINARGDDRSWPWIMKELQGGATLLRVPKLRRAYPDQGRGPYGQGITDTRLRKLERAGTIHHVGVDRYALSEVAAAQVEPVVAPPQVEDQLPLFAKLPGARS